MKLTLDQKLDVISQIDEEIIDRNTEKRARLLAAISSRARIGGAVLARRLGLVGTIAAMFIAAVIAIALILRPDGGGSGTLPPAASLELVESENGKDTYRITYVDGSSALFTVDSADGGIDGVRLNTTGEIVLGFVGGSELNIGSIVGVKESGETSDTSIAGVVMSDDGELSVTLASDESIRLGRPQKPFGEDGAYMTKAAINGSGELVLGFSSGEEINLGRVVGRDGEDGVGIEGIFINDDGELIVTLTNGTEVNLGDIRGVGIEKTEINANGELIITYTDGKVANLGRVVGADGVGIKTVTISDDGYLSMTLTDGTTVELGCVKGEDGKSAYELYREHYGYTGTEEEWLFDLANGNLASKITYTVRFDSTGGSYVAEQKVDRGMKADEPAAPERAGYVFDGWYVGDERWSFLGYSVTEDIVLTARWKIVTYNIKYELGEGRMSGSPMVTYTVLDSFSVPDATHPELVFAGWTYKNAEIPEKDLTVPVGTHGDLTFIAHYRLAETSYTAPVVGSVVTEYSESHKGIDVAVLEGTVAVSCNNGYVREVVGDGSAGYTVKIELPSGNATLVYSGLISTELSIGQEVLRGDSVGTVGKLDICGVTDAHLHFAVEIDGEAQDPAVIIPENVLQGMNGDGYEYELLDDGCLAIVSYKGTRTTVVIPTEYDGRAVVSIGRDAFKNNSYLEHLIVSEGIKSIEYDAFYGCTALETLELPASLEILWHRAFSNCPHLVSITVNEGNALMLSEDNCVIKGDTLLLGCQTSKIPSGVKSIAEYAFFKCSWLGSIDIPEGVEHIGANAFAHCTGVYSLSLPSTIKRIDTMAFQTSVHLTEVKLPASLERIASDTFQGCKSIEVLSIDPQNTTYRSEGNCIIDKNGVVVIGCKTSVIPVDGSIQAIGSYAFYNQTELTRISIPTSVKSIGKGAFAGCLSLTTVFYDGSDSDYAKISIGENNDPLTLITPTGCIAGEPQLVETCLPTCKDDGYYYYAICCVDCGREIKREKVIIETDGVHKVENGFCVGCDLPESSSGLLFTLNNDGKGYTVSQIGSCTDEEIVIGLYRNLPVTKIARDAFLSCNTVKSVMINTGADLSIEPRAFAGCDKLERVIMLDGVSEIAELAFSDCRALKLVTIPESVTVIGNDAFYSEYPDQSLVKLTLVCASEQDVDGWSSEWNRYCINDSLNQSYSYDVYSVIYSSYYDNESGLLYKTDGTVIGAIKVAETLTVPSEIRGVSIKSIGERAFYGNKEITKVILPGGISSIGAEAFRGCTNLSEVKLPDLLCEIGDGAFSRTGLKELVLPTNLTYIGKNSFSETYITSVTIPRGVNEIKQQAFFRCKALTSVVISDGVSVIGHEAFQKCALLSDLTLPDSLLKIEAGAFSGCTSLSEITVPHFTKSISTSAFSGCSGLTRVEFLSTDAEIGKGAFQGATALSELILPAAVETIGEHAFGGCCLLKRVHIPDSVTSIGAGAFSGCHPDAQLTVDENNPYYIAIGECIVEKDSGVVISSLTGDIQDDERIKAIGKYAFSGIKGIKEIKVPSSVVSIGEYAFIRCEDLERVILHDGILRIGECAFQNCKALREFTLPKLVTSIPSGCFMNCESLESVTLHDGVESLDTLVFYGCSSLTSVELPEGITSLSSAFGHSGIKTLVVPDSVTELSSAAFAYCKSLETLTVGKGVKLVKDATLDECTALVSLTVKSPDMQFSNKSEFLGDCTSLTDIYFVGTEEEYSHYDFYSYAPNGAVNILYVTE